MPGTNGISRPRIGELAVERALVSQEHVDMCVDYQNALRGGSNKRLGEILVEKNLLTSAQVGRLLDEQQEIESAWKPATPRPQPAAQAAEPEPAAQDEAGSLRSPLRSPVFYGLLAAIVLGGAIALVLALWPVPGSQGALVAYLKGSTERGHGDPALAVRDFDLVVRKFRVEEVGPAARFEWSAAEHAALASHPGGWSDLARDAGMPQDKARALALAAPILPPLAAQAASLRIEAQPVTCYIIFKARAARLYKKGIYRFLMVKADTGGWTSGWRLGDYERVDQPEGK